MLMDNRSIEPGAATDGIKDISRMDEGYSIAYQSYTGAKQRKR